MGSPDHPSRQPGNRDLEAAWAYHNATKHTYHSVRVGPRGLDWDNQPIPYKIYTTLEPLPLPRDLPLPHTPALEAIASRLPDAGMPGASVPDLPTLASVLFLSAGITRRLRLPDGSTMPFRAAACTGALYHIELYVVCGDLPGLAAGVYHFSVHDFALRRLRAGDWRPTLVAATAQEPAIARAPAIVVCTTTFWRNAWKYRDRAYRHAFWDCGTILANLLAVAAGAGLPARVVCGFVDGDVNRLLDLDTHREVAIVLVALGRESAPPGVRATTGDADGLPPPPPLGLPTAPLSAREVDYPAIRAMHAASSLTAAEEVRAWRGTPPAASPPPTGPLVPLRPLPADAWPQDSITRVIRRRGSSRRFQRAAITFAELSTVLERATGGVPADFLEPADGTPTLVDVYLIAHAVDGLSPGAYVLHRQRHALELLRPGAFRRQAGYLALEQPLAADASVNVYCLADLSPILARFGNRGYRAAQLEAGITGGRIYLAAYALGLGATGLTFYDDDVTAFFSPHAAGKSVLFLTAVGHPVRRAR
ncbi:MAG: SagB/ThcOx family dehydrogenase [Armatimonadota bacterium]|nr:SagB/ThcOx family dehydrogenase [Armatimonadota bacterium]